MTRYQAASLLANCFLCTFPPRADRRHVRLHRPNFEGLYNFLSRDECRAKMYCILNYFERLRNDATHTNGAVTFERRSQDVASVWSTSSTIMIPDQRHINVEVNEVIENSESDRLKVDFANKLVGGSVIGQGCVQVAVMIIIERLAIFYLYVQITHISMWRHINYIEWNNIYYKVNINININIAP